MATINCTQYKEILYRCCGASEYSTLHAAREDIEKRLEERASTIRALERDHVIDARKDIGVRRFLDLCDQYERLYEIMYTTDSESEDDEKINANWNSEFFLGLVVEKLKLCTVPDAVWNALF